MTVLRIIFVVLKIAVKIMASFVPGVGIDVDKIKEDIKK